MRKIEASFSLMFWVLSSLEVTIMLTDSYSDSCFVRLFLTRANVSEPVLDPFVQLWNLSTPPSRIYFSAFFSIPSRSFVSTAASQSSPTSFRHFIGRWNRWDPYPTQAEFDSLWSLWFFSCRLCQVKICIWGLFHLFIAMPFWYPFYH
jgi:hypothetical protein